MADKPLKKDINFDPFSYITKQGHFAAGCMPAATTKQEKVKIYIMEHLLQYSPVIIVVVMYLIQQRVVVTPEQLEKKHREILKDIENRFASLSTVTDLKEQVSDMKEKIDRIYECIIAVK